MKRASECTEKKYARHNTQGDESVIVVEEETKIEVEIRTEANIAVSAEFLLEKSDEQPLVTAPPGLHGSGEIGAADDLERFLQVPAQAYFYDCPMSDCTHLDSSRPLIGIQELRECLRACNDNEEGPTYSERDFKRASDMAKQGDPVAMYMLSGDMFFPRVGTPSSKARRLELLAAAAEKGWIPAHDALIWHFLHEDGSDGTALEWSRLKKACWPAFKRLIEKDRGVSPQFAGSPNETYLLCDFMWQLQLARRGIAGAQRRVASHLLFDEPCIEAQQRKAYTWLDRAVAAGDAKAMLALGMMYEHGIAVEAPRLKGLYLDSNDLSEEAAEDIADVIRQARALEVLELRDNAFTDASYQTIATAMRGNLTLRRVHIDAELDSEASRLIRGLCARNRNLQKLWAEFKWSSPLRFITVPTELSELLEQHLLLEDQKGGTQSASATRQRVLEMLMCLQPMVLQEKPVAKTT